jgi:hypothetical protein
MTADTFFKAVMEKLERRPFQPFAFELMDGRRVAITRSHSVTIRGGKAMCFDDKGRLVDLTAESTANVVDAPTGVSV